MTRGTHIQFWTPQTPQETREKERQRVTSTTTRAHARGVDADAVLAYAAAGGLPETPGMRAYIGRLMAAMEPEVIIAAIDDTFMAPRPSWRYFAAICRRLEAEGIQTRAQWDADAAAFAAAGRRVDAGGGQPAPSRAPVTERPSKEVGAHRYTQRSYTDEELEKLLLQTPLDELRP